jgi:hypothetical protein
MIHVLDSDTPGRGPGTGLVEEIDAGIVTVEELALLGERPVEALLCAFGCERSTSRQNHDTQNGCSEQIFSGISGHNPSPSVFPVNEDYLQTCAYRNFSATARLVS